MTAASMLPDHPPPRVKHGWRCLAVGPCREEVRETKHGPLPVLVCQSCGGSDLADRVHAEKPARPT